MNRRRLFELAMFVSFTFAMTLQVLAGEPTDKMRETTDKILAILSDPSLKGEAKLQERKKLIRKVVEERFDWEEMAARALARHWAQRTEEEKKEFVALYSQLVERTYMDRVEGYSGEKVTYEGEVVEGDYAVVKVVIRTSKGVAIPVHYRLRKKRADWLVYDISIEGVSMVKNYREQFNNIISRSSYKQLVERLREKVPQ